MKIIGHRGARGLAPENTLASLQKALDHHVDQIEFDVRVTKDGIPLLHHDPRLADPSGSKHLVAKTNYTELKQHKNDLTTLAEALDLLAGKVALCIEVKPDEPIEAIVSELKKVRLANVSLGSKSQKTLLALHQALPDVHKIVIEPWSGVRASRRARQVGTTEISMNQLWLWRGFITPVSRRGWQLNAYTLNNPKRAARWQRYGLNGVITDYPDRFEE
jgi:glycerophosphoryl diester phosphodiesterase